MNPLRVGPLNPVSQFEDTKDPCPVFDGELWHLFGSGGSVKSEHWRILHAVSDNLYGPWQEVPPSETIGITGEHVAAPGVVFDNGLFHMFVQTEFMALGGSVEYLTSVDGRVFTRRNCALGSLPETEEAGVYDPHPSIIDGQKYLVYAAMGKKITMGRILIQPDIYLARSISGDWGGPWYRLGKILDHSQITWHHNQPEHPDYEWGIVGPQLVELPSGRILLNATCFLPDGKFGTRQRVFFAGSEKAEGPYFSMGPVIDPAFDTSWGSGENGHATVVLAQGELNLFYQARNSFGCSANPWRFGMAVFDLKYLKVGAARE